MKQVRDATVWIEAAIVAGVFCRIDAQIVPLVVFFSAFRTWLPQQRVLVLLYVFVAHFLGAVDMSRSPSPSRSSSPASAAPSSPGRVVPNNGGSPVPESNAVTRAAMEMEAPDSNTQLLLLVLSSGASSIAEFCYPLGHERALAMCSCVHVHQGKSGNVFFFAALHNKRNALRQLVAACGGPSAVESLVVPLFKCLIDESRFSTLVFVASLCPLAALKVVDEGRGDTLLHAVCRLADPPVWCVKDLLAVLVALLPPLDDGMSSRSRSRTSSQGGGSRARLLPDINRVNKKQLTALHLAATHIAGTAGRDIVKLLLRHGADETMRTPKGETLTQVCTNGYVRQHLAVTEARHRGVEAQIDPEVKATLDACETSESFPVLPDISEASIVVEKPVTSDDAANGGDEDEGRKKGDPLSQEDEEALVQRLHDQSIREKAKWLDSQYQLLQDADEQRYHSKRLAAEDVEASVARVYQESIDKQTEKMGELVAKYVKERPQGPALEREDVEACSYRLFKGTLEKKAAAHLELVAKYSPPRTMRKLTKEEMMASAQRLCKESQDKTAQELSKLYDEYCVTEKTRFNGGERAPLTAAEVKALGDRLSKK